MGPERVLLDRRADRATTTAPRAAEPQAFASALGNQVFGRLMTAGHPVLARTMAAKVSFAGHFAQGAQLTPAKLRTIHTEITQAWTDMQADLIQVSYVDAADQVQIAAWLTAYDTAMTALMAEIQNGNPADPEQVGIATAAVRTPGNNVLAQKFSAALTPLGSIRDVLNKAWGEWDTDRQSKFEYDEEAEKKKATPVPAAAPVQQAEDYSSWPLLYDEHGDKHFLGQDSQWSTDKNSALEKMQEAIDGIMRQLPETVRRFYQEFPRVEKQRGPAALYYTIRDPAPVGTLGSAKGAPTNVWTIQLDVYPHQRKIGYHGYPDDDYVPEGLKLTKKG